MKVSNIADFSLNGLQEALEIEHQAKQKSLKKYSQKKVKVTAHSNGEYSYLFAKGFFPQKNFNNFSISLCEEFRNNDSVKNYLIPHVYMRGKIMRIDSRTIYFTTSAKLDLTKSYGVVYEYDRTWVDTCTKMISNIQQYQLEKYFETFNDQTIDAKMTRNIKAPKKWFNASIAKDSKQKEAVEKIMTESAYPFPFVVCGGPGTGKTSVLVEAVTQILDKKSFANILITCQSNSACDEIGFRLRKFLPAVKVFRYFTKALANSEATNKDNYFEILKENSSINERKVFVAPSRENLLKFKIVIATMSVTNRLINCDFPKDHFDFIFIDECCAATEPDSLIPIVGLGMDHNKINANIILIGDDKLLGPIVMSIKAKELGLGRKNYE